jgi:hypothetical protein
MTKAAAIIAEKPACSVAAKQPSDESQKSLVYIIEVRRSVASIFGEAKAILKSGGKPRTFATLDEAQAEAKALQDALAVETVTYHAIQKD